MDSENLSSLIQLSVSDGQKTHSSKVVSVIATNHRVLPRSRATRELVALRLERVCSVLFTPIHLQIRIDNFFCIAEFRYLYGVDTGNQSRSN